MCLQHQLLGVPDGGERLVLLHYAKVGLSCRCYENCSTFFSLVPGAKEKNLFSKCLFLKFWKKISECSSFLRCSVKNSYISTNFIKNELHQSDFSVLCDVNLRVWIELKNRRTFPKNHVFLVLRVHKNALMTIALRHVVGFVNFNIRAKF